MVLLSSKHEKSRSLSGDFSIVYAIYHQMVTIIYFPMQKFLKIEWRRSVVVMVPVMVPRWWIVSRRSWAMKSPEMPAAIPWSTLWSESPAWTSAS